jgi:hypothetical protein
MAEFLEITKIRNYELSNGTTVDLVALIDNGAPADWRAPVIEELAVGQVAYVDALGEMRRGVIVKIGRTKVHVAFTTQGAIDHQARYRTDAGIRVQTTAAMAGHIRVAPLATPVTEDQQEADERGELHRNRFAAFVDAPEAPEETAEREAEQEELEGTLPEGFTVTAEGEMVEVAPEQDETTEAERAELEAMLDAWEGEGGAVEPIEDDPAAPLDPITGSAIVEVLEETWEAIRANHPDLPHVVIVTGSGFIGSPRWAHWRESGWTERDQADTDILNHVRHGEMFVAGEALAKGAAHVVESMLHEGAHTLATARQVQDTSRQGRWHNGEFRKLAQELGLEYRGDKADPTHGFSNMLLTDATREEYAPLIEKLDKAIRAIIRMPAFVSGASGEQGGGEFIHGGRRPKTGTAGSSTNNLKLTCECEEPKIIRASKKVAELGVIRCDDCGELFEDRS